jgi:hypothetical protein
MFGIFPQAVGVPFADLQIRPREKFRQKFPVARVIYPFGEPAGNENHLFSGSQR